jgi:hypothetical protein
MTEINNQKRTSKYIRMEAHWGRGIKGTEMLKKRITTTLRAALILIAVEDLNALRTLFKTISNLTSKSVSMQKKS